MIALLLAVSLLLGNFGLGGNMRVFAAEQDSAVAEQVTEAPAEEAVEEIPAEDAATEDAAPAVEDASSDEASTDAATETTEDSAAADEAVDEAVQDAAADATSDAAVAADEATATDAQAVTETPAAETPAAEVAMPAQSFDGKTDYATVKVTAGDDTFPEGTRMEVKDVPQAEVQGAVEQAVDGEVASITAVDITFYDKDNNEIQPANDKSVRVVIRTPKMDAKADHEVVHIDKEGEAELLTDAKVSGNNAVVEAESFSIYAVVETEVPRLTVTFKNGSAEDIVMYVKGDDTAEEVADIIYDPGVEGVASNEAFYG